MVSRNRGNNVSRRQCEGRQRSMAGRGNPGRWDDSGSPRRHQAPRDNGVARGYTPLTVSQKITWKM